MRPYICTAAAAFLCSSPAPAADSAIGKDLKATIVLAGKPCDKLISSHRNGDSDYTAACKDGNRYHIFINAQGRVVVQKT